MRIAYLDCFSGISGDMLVGALLDAGLSFDKLKKEIAKLKLTGFSLEAKKIKKHKLWGMKFTVRINKKQPQRNLQDIIRTINKSNVESAIKEETKEIFTKLAQVEAEIHRININKIHFHEIGAVDTVVDVVSILWGIKELGIRKIYVSPVNVGNGWVKTTHGLLPVPAPATLELLRNMSIYSSDISEELTTPTGAVLVSVLGEKADQLPKIKPDVIGYGAGDKNFDEYPNLLRIIIGQENKIPVEYQKEDLIQIETNIDDLNPQIFGYLMERLFSEGALDVWYSQIQMKKNRPGVCLQVLVPGNLLEKILETIFSETTTWGIRCYQMNRYKIPTKVSTLKTKFGKIKAKLGWVKGKVRIIPEYEECKKIAQTYQIPLKMVFDEITKD